MLKSWLIHEEIYVYTNIYQAQIQSSSQQQPAAAAKKNRIIKK